MGFAHIRSDGARHILRLHNSRRPDKMSRKDINFRESPSADFRCSSSRTRWQLLPHTSRTTAEKFRENFCDKNINKNLLQKSFSFRVVAHALESQHRFGTHTHSHQSPARSTYTNTHRHAIRVWGEIKFYRNEK